MVHVEVLVRRGRAVQGEPGHPRRRISGNADILSFSVTLRFDQFEGIQSDDLIWRLELIRPNGI